jgi:hypothetical protein
MGIVMDSGARKSAVEARELFRSDWERRERTQDRRVSGVDQRLRRGLWLEFHRRTDLGKFEPLPISLRSRDHLSDAAMREAVRYRFFDRNTGAETATLAVITATIEAVWDAYSRKYTDDQRSVFMIDAIADYLLSKFEISIVDRRNSGPVT